MRLEPLLLAIALLLSGCTGGDAAGPAAEPAQQTVSIAGPADSGSLEDGGSIEGLVVDESVAPIAGATIGIDGFPETALSGPDGAFAFNGVPGGTHTVFAAALGFGSAGKSVEVRVGEISTVTFTLASMAIENATYTELTVFNGFIPCGFGLVAVTVSAACPTGSSFTPGTDTEDVLTSVLTIFDELVWTQNSAASATRLYMDAGYDQTCNPCSYAERYGRSPAGTSPIVLRMDGPFKGISDAEDQDAVYEVHHQVWVPGNDGSTSGTDPTGEIDGLPVIVVEQSFTLYTTLFYGEPAPENFPGSRPDA